MLPCLLPSTLLACLLPSPRPAPPLPAALLWLPCRKFTGSPVTSQPDVTELALHDGDEFVIMASDGLWDVMESQEVVKLARRDLQRGHDPQVCGVGGWVGDQEG
jgi:serine/threonine protein phosphatase PrpC